VPPQLLSCSRQPHKLIEIKCAATFVPTSRNSNLIPGRSSDLPDSVFVDTHRFARDHAMNDLFVFGTVASVAFAATQSIPCPTRHKRRGRFSKSEVTRISGDTRGDVLQCPRITDLSNSLANGRKVSAAIARKLSVRPSRNFQSGSLMFRHKWILA